MKKYRKLILLVLIISVISPLFQKAKSQHEEKINPRMHLQYFNNSGIKALEVTLSARIERKNTFLSDLEVSFYIIADTQQILIGNIITNDKGKASIVIPEDKPYLSPIDSFYTYKAITAENDQYEACETEIKIRDAMLEIFFLQKDEGKTISLKALEIDINGGIIPINDAIINFYVPRTFTLLKIGEGLTSNGTSQIDFPISLPGDSLGYLTVVAKLEDHDIFGNVETSGRINWGKPLPPVKVVKRGLGDTDAPLWMVYTLIVLLSTVWFHYLYAIFTIYLIKRESKKPEILPEELQSK
ncbi:hypothetical protein ACFL6I_27115, partial [candidate division KSB1 bacterium]